MTSTSTTLHSVEQNPSVKLCGDASGFRLNPPPGKPSAAQLNAICAASACRTAIASLSAIGLPSCTISMLNGINLREIVDEISAQCQTRSADNESGVANLKLSAAGRSPPQAPPAGATPSTPAPTTINSKTNVKGKAANLRKNCHS